MIDKRVYMLTIIAFIVGMVELIIGGILDLVADDLDVTIGTAGLLISIFSLVFGISAPILLVVFAKTERTKLTFVSLIIFLIGNIIAVFSSSFELLILSRVVSAASGSLVIILCINLASNIVEPAYRGRAIGLVVMGVSGSLVLGLPIGVMLGNMFGWRAPFVLISILTILLIIAVPIFMEKVAPKQPIPIRKQIATLKNAKISLAHATTFFFLAGHFTLYGYLTPYTKEVLGFSGTTISVLYFVYGLAAFSGGGLGGLAADYLGKRRTILSVIVLLAAALLLIPTASHVVWAFWIVVIIWGIMSWGVTPSIQSHLMELSPETSDIQQSLNNSALHFGIAFGTFFGGFVVKYAGIEHVSYFGIIFVALAFVSATLSTRNEAQKFRRKPAHTHS
ncbi:MFS transporter [Pseudogracilibacillus sp. SO10305]|uniref:MFS transporter n=1 Tax=Pseudogracilibacillus sp. SO10305 TaxID=3098292 RepID=UPI00300E4E37